MDVKKASKEVVRNSRFLHLFTKNNTFCLLHSLTLRKVYGGEILQTLYEAFSQPHRVNEIVDRLCTSYPRDLLNHVIADLKEKGLIVSADKEVDLKTYVKLFQQGLQQYIIQNMYFIPTNECNFRCKYCFVEDEKRKFNPVHMTQDTAEKGLEVFAKLTEDAEEISISFYGGEPLLNADVVYSSMRYVRALERKGAFKRPVDMTLLTNGALVDDITIEAVLETQTKVSISLDGPENLHNAARKDVVGNNTFDEALAAYRMLQEAGVTPGISCTISRFNVEHIEEIVDFIVNELRPPGIGFNILLPTINGGNPLDVSHEFAASQLIVAFKTFREKGIYEDRMMRRVRPYVENGFHFKDCMGVGGQIVLTPEGRIGPCQAFLGLDEFFPLTVDTLHSQLSTITSEDIYEDILFDEWRHRFPLNMEQCVDCFAIAVCGGGCPYASFVNHGSIWEIDERICSQSKQIMEWMLWDTYDHLIEASKKELTFSNQ
jgi:uncharacterized protein